LSYAVAGTVDGIGPNGYAYSKSDVCETGDYTGYLKEQYCDGTLARAQRYSCPDGCADGACIATCTDVDGDGYALEGGLCGAVDCDDAAGAVNPGATEACDNGIDDNCDGRVDADDPQCTVCTDADGDGYALEGGVCGAVDCDDGDAAVNPGATEACGNGVDDDCDGLVDTAEPVCSAPNVIVVGWDGAQRDHFWECYNSQLPECPDGLPNIEALGGGVIYDAVVTSGDTATKPGWAQIFSGYDADVMGIYSNGEYQPLPEGYSIFEKLENHLGPENVVTMFISGKGVNTGAACIGDPTTVNGQPAIEDQGQPWCLTKDHLDYYENDLRRNATVGNRALELLEAHKNDLFVAAIIFRDQDVTAHVAGENSEAYSRAIRDDDEWLGLIMDKVAQLGIADRTHIYVMTDHGIDEGDNRHGNAPYIFLATNDPAVVRGGDRKDLAPTILEHYGVSLGQIGNAPAVDGYSLYSTPSLTCISEGEAFLDYPGAPACCAGLQLISLDGQLAQSCNLATGGTGDSSGYCTACGDGVCTEPENICNCPADCTAP
jgi:hypothetical protein